MNRKIIPFCISLLLLLLTVTGLGAQSEGERIEPLVAAPVSGGGEMVDETPTLWFVELSHPPQADGGSGSSIAAEQRAWRNAARQNNLNYRERYAFGTLWNGLSIAAAPSQAARLARMPGVSAVYPVVTVSLPQTTALTTPELATALAMTGADIAQNSLGLSGSGVRVAVMDTGVDYHHPDLGGCFGAGCRVRTGYDFVGDAFNADPASASYNPVPLPDPDPDDCNGHGTHVAGIVGASAASAGGVTGVAPGVTFGAYRVFGCSGSTTADIMIAAMERALADNMQVLNMSIGSAFQWPQYPTAAAADRLVNKGMVVVASIGNSGANGLYSAGAPGLGKKVIGVASVDNTHVTLSTFTISPDGTAIGYGQAAGAPAAPTSGSAPMARTGTATTTNDACLPLPAGSLAGQVALIRRGTCSFYAKAFNAQSAGATGVVLYNNSAGRFSPTVAGSPPIVIPVVAISDSEGVLINNRLAAGPVTMTWTSSKDSFANATANLISSFSSYGLSPDLALKPDISAPGGLIYSTYPLENDGYATLSGTSMAAPHVAGAAALLLQARPNTPSNAMRTILQNSADPLLWWGNPGLGFLDNVQRQGAGMLDIDDAIVATTRIEPGKLALGESEGGPSVQKLTISNNGGSAATYSLSHLPALATGSNTFAPSFFTSFASANFSPSSIMIAAGASATVDVTISAPGTPAKGMYGGYIVISDGSSSYSVPYAGFMGDYQSIQVLAPTVNGFPWLAKLVGSSFSNQPAGASYTMDGDDVPFVLVHLDHQVRRLRMEVFDANSGRSWHRALELPYVARNSSATGFFAFAWDGMTTNGNRTNTVPNGSYVLKLSVQKALGDDDNPAHWETWTSPPIIVARP